MRKVYFIRHGDVETPGGESFCLGTADFPLSAAGRARSVLLSPGFESWGVSEVFSSPLSRALETAALMGARPIALPGLAEAGQGDWDGLPFSEIRERWPELYAARGRDRTLLPPGAEEPDAVLGRFSRAVGEALECTRGDIALVTHRSALRLFLGSALGLTADAAARLELHCGSVTRLEWSGGRWELCGRAGQRPHPELLPPLCLRLLEADAPDRVAAHCRAVEREALRLVCALAAAGVYPDEFAVSAGALLHDIARTEPEHAARGAELLEAIGYPRIASIVRQHHGLDEPEHLDEAAVVFLADKLVLGAKHVGLESRFAESEARCSTPEARASHERQLEQARALRRRINSLCGKTVVA